MRRRSPLGPKRCPWNQDQRRFCEGKYCPFSPPRPVESGTGSPVDFPATGMHSGSLADSGQAFRQPGAWPGRLDSRRADELHLVRSVLSSVAPIIVPLFLVAAPPKMVLPKKGSLFFPGSLNN